MADGTRITLAAENLEYFLQKVTEHIVYLDESLEKTLTAFVAEVEPYMRKPRGLFGRRKPYWTHEFSPEPRDVDIWLKETNQWLAKTAAEWKSQHKRTREVYDSILMALLNGDVVSVPRTTYDEIVITKESESWLPVT